MAEMNIGRHCAFTPCNRLDFLPFHCPSCGSIYCLDHKTPDSHDCPQKDASPDNVKFEGEKSYSCVFAGCKNRELMKVICPACEKNFCLSHRHQTEHECEKYEAPTEKMTQTKQHVQTILDSKKNASATKKPTQGRKSKATAAKVALMKIKMKAVGEKGTPDTERVFLNVILPLTSSTRSKPMFFCKKWSLGRIIDQIAKTCALENKNNVATAKKLRLFDPDDGHIYPTEQTLESLMGEDATIFNGGSVILEYVDNDTQSLESHEHYKV